MKRVGILTGREVTFPESMIKSINENGGGTVVAEMVTVGGIPLDDLWYEYNQTGTLCMTLQEGIEYDQFVRCYCVGKEKVLIMPYDPSKLYLSGMQYVNVDNYLTPELHARVDRDVITICTALGYDLNTVEFAIKDDIPY